MYLFIYFYFFLDDDDSDDKMFSPRFTGDKNMKNGRKIIYKSNLTLHGKLSRQNRLNK